MTRVDPFESIPQARRLPVSIFYPTSESAIAFGTYSFAPYFPSSETAAAFDTYIGNSTEILGITTRSYDKAPIKSVDFPVLIFSHGLGSSRVMYTAQLEDLASHGWIILALDHPHDALVTEFADGTVVLMDPTVLDDFPNELPGLIEIRVADVEFIATTLKNSSTVLQIPRLSSTGRNLNSKHIGILGHSLGGATAAQAVANSSVFPCGANFDGGIFGPVAETGLDKPFLQIEAQDHPQTSDGTFAEFWNHLRGFRREFMVNGTVHASFIDIPIVRDVLGDAFPDQENDQYGIIGGERLLEIETALIDAFFAICLKGASAGHLDRLTMEFSELSLPQNGTYDGMP